MSITRSELGSPVPMSLVTLCAARPISNVNPNPAVAK